jgi:hypothetical protein
MDARSPDRHSEGEREDAPAGHSDVPCILHLPAGDLGIQGLGRAARLLCPVYHRSIMATRVETTVGEQAFATRPSPPGLTFTHIF